MMIIHQQHQSETVYLAVYWRCCACGAVQGLEQWYKPHP